MAKKKSAAVSSPSSATPSKAAAKAAKKEKAAKKVERKEQKKSNKSKVKSKDEDDSDEDLESVLDKLRREWEEAHTVTEELVEGPPSRRANATVTPCPSGNYLWCIGGEFFSEDKKAYFYNDVFRYFPEKDEWRKFVSKSCPGPRSAHAVVASPSGGGKLWLFGGEFSSLHQTTFHHYRDFWCFDLTTHTWERIDTKITPTSRSGHRMAMWKHYIVLFGGFYDPGVTTRYLNDLWLFDTQEYKWRQIEKREGERWPSPRSGFSFLPTADGVVLHGGYCKEYVKGKRPVGVMLEDTWLLKITLNATPEASATATPSSKNKTASVSAAQQPLTVKWEKRKKVGYAPGLRSGCTMGLWAAKGMGVLFGGVTDEDTNEETLESMFHNDLYGYQLSGNGRWVSLTLRKPKKKGPKKKPTREAAKDGDNDGGSEGSEGDDTKLNKSKPGKAEEDPDLDPDDPNLTVPLPRYNAMLAVVRNTLYIYGGIYEQGSREYTLDDFYALQLEKMDQYLCLRSSDVALPKDGEVESSSSEDDDSSGDDEQGGSDSDDQESAVGDVEGAVEKMTIVEDIAEEVEKEDVKAPDKDALRTQATAFMGVSMDATRSPEDVISTPLPGETLAAFYARSREYWKGKAHSNSEHRGKQLRRDGFVLAQEKYTSYKPILQEVEKILAEAGLDEEEMKKSAAAGGAGTSGAPGQSRNRR